MGFYFVYFIFFCVEEVILLKITKKWIEVPLSATNTYTRIQNISGKVILLALSSSLPSSEEAKNAIRLDYFDEGVVKRDVYIYDHSTDQRKLYVMGLYLDDNESGYISVY